MRPLKIGILYAESRFTPWKENIDTQTVVSLYRALPKDSLGTIIHMVEPCQELAQLLRRFDYVINACYGFKKHSQADIACWLDAEKVRHLSSGGMQQQMAQDKLEVENILLANGLDVPISIQSVSDLEGDLFIAKPRFGGCHRGIEVLDYNGAHDNFSQWQSQNKLVQPYLLGREFSIAVIPTETGDAFTTLPPLEVIPFPKRAIYLAGQSHGTTRRSYFPNITPVEFESLQHTAIAAHKALGLTFMSRVDIRYKNGIAYILDVNTMPNLHPTKSMLPGLLKVHKIGKKAFIGRLILMGDRIYTKPLKPQLSDTEGEIYVQ